MESPAIGLDLNAPPPAEKLALWQELKHAMLAQELLFRDQVRELHRLYWRQRRLMRSFMAGRGDAAFRIGISGARMPGFGCRLEVIDLEEQSPEPADLSALFGSTDGKKSSSVVALSADVIVISDSSGTPDCKQKSPRRDLQIDLNISQEDELIDSPDCVLMFPSSCASSSLVPPENHWKDPYLTCQKEYELDKAYAHEATVTPVDSKEMILPHEIADKISVQASESKEPPGSSLIRSSNASNGSKTCQAIDNATDEKGCSQLQNQGEVSEDDTLSSHAVVRIAGNKECSTACADRGKSGNPSVSASPENAQALSRDSGGSNDTPINNQLSETQFSAACNASVEGLTDLSITTAATTLLLFSDTSQHHSGHFTRENNPVLDTTSDQSEYSLGSFEMEVLNLNEIKDDGLSMPTGTRPETQIGNCGIKLRRGRGLRNFQRDILPGLVSLGRHEICDDLHAIGQALRRSQSKKPCGDALPPLRTRLPRRCSVGWRG